MPNMLKMTHNGTEITIPLTQNTRLINALPDTKYELVDEHGRVLHEYTTNLENGDLWIDLGETAVRPDIILENYGQYYSTSSFGHGAFGSSMEASGVSQYASVSAPISAETSVLPTVAKTATVATSWTSANTLAVIGGLVVVAGGAAAAGGGGGGDSGASIHPNTPNNGSSNNSSSWKPSNGHAHTGSGNGSNGNTNHDGSDYLHGNKIVLPAAYTKDLLRNGSIQAIAKAAKGGMEMNKYISSAEDEKIIIQDVNDLPDNVRIELSHFLAGLMNPLRKAWGVGEYKVVKGALDFAEAVANEYTDHHVSIHSLNGHYNQGIKHAAAQFGLKTGGQYYENAHWTKSTKFTGVFTLDELKHNLYDSTVRMLFQDEGSHQGHAKSLLNCTGYDDQDSKTDFLGVDTSAPSKQELSFHFIATADHRAYIGNENLFNKTFNKTPVGYTEKNKYFDSETLSSVEADNHQDVEHKITLSDVLDTHALPSVLNSQSNNSSTLHHGLASHDDTPSVAHQDSASSTAATNTDIGHLPLGLNLEDTTYLIA